MAEKKSLLNKVIDAVTDRDEKAGLAKNSYKEKGVEIYRFGAEVF